MDIKNLVPVKYSDEVILTTEQLAQFYECDNRQIKQNFNNNAERFVEGKHYFKLEGEELNKLRVENFDLQISSMTRILYLWTKRGAARHAKMLTTEKAWQVFEELEENYFNNHKEQIGVSAQVKPSDIIGDAIKSATLIENYFGLKKGIAFAHAVVTEEKFFSVDLQSIKSLIPPAEHETGYLNATQLGEKVGKSARDTNMWLSDNGYQYKDSKGWRLTEKGRHYAEEIPYDTGKHSGYQIRWGLSTAELFLDKTVY